MNPRYKPTAIVRATLAFRAGVPANVTDAQLLAAMAHAFDMLDKDDGHPDDDIEAAVRFMLAGFQHADWLTIVDPTF